MDSSGRQTDFITFRARDTGYADGLTDENGLSPAEHRAAIENLSDEQLHRRIDTVRSRIYCSIVSCAFVGHTPGPAFGV